MANGCQMTQQWTLDRIWAIKKINDVIYFHIISKNFNDKKKTFCMKAITDDDDEYCTNREQLSFFLP